MRTAALTSILLSLSVLTSCSSDNNFKTSVIDCGIVVRDINKSREFYESIGFLQITRFDVPKKISGDAGLSNYNNLSVSVMALAGDPEGSKVKLVESEYANTADSQYIDTTVGISYLTIFVSDLSKILDTLKKKKIRVLKNGPVDLSAAGFTPNYLIVIQDPDGNFIELVGPISTD